MMLLHLHLIFFICFLQSGINRSNGLEFRITNAEQVYKISKSYECGHPVQYKIYSCHCGCDDEKINEVFYRKYGYNENECNESNLLCFTISAKLNTTTKKCLAGLNALCALRFSPKYIYRILILESPSQFYGLSISRHGDKDEEISLPTKYPTLLIDTTAIRVKHVYPYKKLFVPRTGLHFVREDTRKIYIGRKIFNSDKGKINLKNLCWNQVTNHDAVMNEIRRSELMTDGVCSDTCDQQVCDGNPNGLNITKIRQIKGFDSEDSELPGIEINLLDVDVLNATVSFYYDHDKELYIEPVPDFIPLVQTVCRNNEKIYVKLYPNSTNTQNPVSIEIYDNKSMISQQNNMLNEIVTLEFQNNSFHYSEPVCEGFIDYGITTSIPSLVTEMFSRTNTEQENATFVNIDSSNLSNNTAINSTYDKDDVLPIILISSVFVIVVGTALCIYLYKLNFTRKNPTDPAVSTGSSSLSSVRHTCSNDDTDSLEVNVNLLVQEGNINPNINSTPPESRNGSCITCCVCKESFNNRISGQGSGNQQHTGCCSWN